MVKYTLPVGYQKPRARVPRMNRSELLSLQNGINTRDFTDRDYLMKRLRENNLNLSELDLSSVLSKLDTIFQLKRVITDEDVINSVREVERDNLLKIVPFEQRDILNSMLNNQPSKLEESSILPPETDVSGIFDPQKTTWTKDELLSIERFKDLQNIAKQIGIRGVSSYSNKGRKLDKSGNPKDRNALIEQILRLQE